MNGLLDMPLEVLDVAVMRNELRIWRKQVGDSQESVAEFLGVDQTQVSKFETGKTNTFDNSDIIDRMAEYIMDAKRRYRAKKGGRARGAVTQVQPVPAQAPAPPVCYRDTYCPNCDTWVPGIKQGFALCGVCGWELGCECPKCGELNDRDNAMCKSCGCELKPGKSRTPEAGA